MRRIDEEGTAVFRLAASPTDDEAAVVRSLYGAMFTYGRIARLVIEEAGGDVADLDEFCGHQFDLVYELAPSRRSKIGRSEPCPCGSGKKFKLSHGA